MAVCFRIVRLETLPQGTDFRGNELVAARGGCRNSINERGADFDPPRCRSGLPRDGGGK